jgi:ketosteroid isomerase-like protein
MSPISRLQALHDTFDLGLLLGDAGLCASVYAPNAVVAPPSQELIYGREEIREFWQNTIDDGCRGHWLKRESVSLRIGQIVERGRYLHFEHPVLASSPNERGHYVLVLERQTDGDWAWALDVWTERLAAAHSLLPSSFR